MEEALLNPPVEDSAYDYGQNAHFVALMRQCNPIALTAVNFVLACGLIVTVFSDLPSLRLFGWLSAFAMLAALAADLLILRPTVTVLSRLARRIGGKPFYR